jgi:D-glycerate 3-kinase
MAFINQYRENDMSYMLDCFLSPDTIEALKKREQPFILGISGVQGIGKTTFARRLKSLLRHHHLSVLDVSLDDFYLPYEKRLELLKKYPFLEFRGPPGTHDLNMLSFFFQQLFDSTVEYLAVPVFDKSLHSGQGDFSHFYFAKKPHVLLFDGWFVGFSSLGMPYSSALNGFSDKSLLEYEFIWEYFHFILLLKPKIMEYSILWRTYAERTLKRRTGQGMSDEKVREFVNYFWKSLEPRKYWRQMEKIYESKISSCQVSYERRWFLEKKDFENIFYESIK